MTATVAPPLPSTHPSTSPASASPGAGEPLLALDPTRLSGHGRRLSSTADGVREQPPPEPPDTGSTSAATARHLDRLRDRTDDIAAEARTLSEMLDRVVGILRDADDTVAAALTRVRAGAGR